METLLVVFFGILIIGYVWYVSLIGKRNSALEALSGIDVQLRKRTNLVPNILKIARRFMEHEKALLTEITKLRQQLDDTYDPKDADEVRNHLEGVERFTSRMAQFMVQVENYPELKSDQTMVQAMQTYNEVEAQISAARRFYNSSVTALNNAIQIFPGNIIAGMASVTEMPFYETDEASKQPVDAGAYLG